MNEKLMKITCKLKTDSETIMFVLFPTFKTNKETQLLTVSVNEEFKFILNGLVKNFTRFDLKEYIDLSSKYSKNLYRLLKQYRNTGKYEVSIKNFREIMDCPDSYSNKYVMDLIIKPSLKELQNCFENLKCEPKYAKKRGRPVTGYVFSFTPENRKSESDQEPVQEETKCSIKKSSNEFVNFKQRTYDYDELEKALINHSKSDQIDELQLNNMLDELKK